jgi:ABC-type uncharacterized transport system substrate-binding protein
MATPKNFATIKEFSLANNIPFYVPSEALVDQGAVASVTTLFQEMGVLAADLTRRALTGSLDTDQVFPEKVHVTVNLTAAVRTGLAIPSVVIKKIDRMIP